MGTMLWWVKCATYAEQGDRRRLWVPLCQCVLLARQLLGTRTHTVDHKEPCSLYMPASHNRVLHDPVNCKYHFASHDH